MAHESPHVCEDTQRLDELIQVSDYAREVVYRKLPFNREGTFRDKADLDERVDLYYFPSKDPHHNQEMIQLACTLEGDSQRPEEDRAATAELQKELENRLRNVPRAADDGSNAESIQEMIDHAWELVYHWHHVLLGSGVARPVAEQDLYLPALQAFGRSGQVQKLPLVLGNPKTLQVLFPDIARGVAEKEQQRELALESIQKEVEGELRTYMAYVLREIPVTESDDLHDPNAPEKGVLTADHKLFLGLLTMVSTLLGPYVAIGVLSALAADLKSGRALFSSLHDFMIGIQALPEIHDELSEEEQTRLFDQRRKILAVLATVLPVLGTTIVASINH